MLISMHIPEGTPEAGVFQQVERSAIMRGTALLIMREKSGDFGDFDSLMGKVNSQGRSLQRFILMGGGVKSCLLQAFSLIIKLKPAQNNAALEFYIPFDGVYDHLESASRVPFYLRCYKQEAERLGVSAAVWLDDKPLAPMPAAPQIRIRLYSSADKMISAIT